MLILKWLWISSSFFVYKYLLNGVICNQNFITKNKTTKQIFSTLWRKHQVYLFVWGFPTDPSSNPPQPPQCIRRLTVIVCQWPLTFAGSLFDYILDWEMNVNVEHQYRQWSMCSRTAQGIQNREKDHLEWRCGPLIETVRYGRWPAANCSLRDSDRPKIWCIAGNAVGEWVNGKFSLRSCTKVLKKYIKMPIYRPKFFGPWNPKQSIFFWPY